MNVHGTQPYYRITEVPNAPQQYTEGPGPGQGLHDAEYVDRRRSHAPRPEQTSLISGENQISPSLNDLYYREFYREDTSGTGRYVNELAVVDTVPVRQWKHAIETPLRFYNMGYKQPLQEGDVLRADDHVHAPLTERWHSDITARQPAVQTSQVNAQQNLMYLNLRAPGINETQSGLSG